MDECHELALSYDFYQPPKKEIHLRNKYGKALRLNILGKSILHEKCSESLEECKTQNPAFLSSKFAKGTVLEGSGNKNSTHPLVIKSEI